MRSILVLVLRFYVLKTLEFFRSAKKWFYQQPKYLNIRFKKWVNHLKNISLKKKKRLVLVGIHCCLYKLAFCLVCRPMQLSLRCFYKGENDVLKRQNT